MKRIFRWKLDFIDCVTPIKLHVYRDAMILHIAEQDGQLYLWALVDECQAPEDRTFHMFREGATIRHDLLGVMKYVATAQIKSGDYTAHIFEEK